MNNTSPLISVIVLCYNQEQTIARTIDSILMQNTEYLFEIIIGEDASPNDKTRLICEEYAEKNPEVINLLSKAPNKGLLKNYSDCLKKSKGKYIATCAGDDWWHNPNKLQLQVEFLENNKDYGLVFTDYRIVNINLTDGKSIFSSSKPVFIQESKFYENLIKSNFISAASTIYKKDIFIKDINFEEYNSLGFLMEDYPMWLEMIQHTKFKYIPIETMTYTISDGSISNNINDIEKTEAFENSVLYIKKHYLKKYPIVGVNNRKLEIIYHNYLTTNFVKNKHFKRARYHSKFIVGTSINGFIKFFVCHTPIVNLYAKYLYKIDNKK